MYCRNVCSGSSLRRSRSRRYVLLKSPLRTKLFKLAWSASSSMMRAGTCATSPSSVNTSISLRRRMWFFFSVIRTVRRSLAGTSSSRASRRTSRIRPTSSKPGSKNSAQRLNGSSTPRSRRSLVCDCCDNSFVMPAITTMMRKPLSLASAATVVKERVLPPWT